ncbi:protein of unknown function [Thauera humireducens]|uniref:hypothetical protein n=1 Tax=Thauera humireducens TaxID=1134435 RepID=UPI002467A1A4|nr:hypothetical protein [Thauera humireducens]CAH1745808.1 protein of unknown function [Thauera humireducens]
MENEVQQSFPTETTINKKLLIQIAELIGVLSDNVVELYKLHEAQAQNLNFLDNQINHIDSELSELYEEVMELQSKKGAAHC